MHKKIKYQLLICAAILVAGLVPNREFWARASGCPELRIVFVRGSGGERWTDRNYLEYKSEIEEKLGKTSLKYEFIDLDYPAVGVGLDNLGVTVGAYIGKGEAYEFGRSVGKGVRGLINLVNGTECAGTKYVIGGYSQGAMVISRAIRDLKPEKVIYVATFGDPKIYLPEGKGLLPKACMGKNLSSYRMYVPDCRAYKGKLGANEPYAPMGFEGKVGTWCNKKDFLCSSGVDMGNHMSYIEDSLYQDASKVIFDKICREFGIRAGVLSTHDTAILIDSTGSMSGMIDKYKAEAVRLARETLDSGGRVALYDYRDLADPYEPVEHCNFETCTFEVFARAIENMQVDGGGDTEESLLSASLNIMKSLKWRFGATKSLVVLTDAPFLLPDRDGVTVDEVVRLSKEIDPVNFYVITDWSLGEYYSELATRTDGMVVTDFGKLNLLTDYIMERFDSLPRVEEASLFAEELPVLEVVGGGKVSGDEFRVKFKTNAEKVAVALNDWIVGVLSEDEVTVGGLDFGEENVLTLIPMSGEVSGESVSVLMSEEVGVGFGLDFGLGSAGTQAPRFIPKAPNTGWR